MAKAKKKREYKKKLVYTCRSKSENVRYVTFQIKNKFGAYDNHIRKVAYTTLQFEFYVNLNQAFKEDAELTVINATFAVETSDKTVADKYIVGQSYRELPLSV